MRVLVTGGAGFIGSHVVDALRAAGHEPFVLDNLTSGRRENLPASVPLYVVNVCDRESVKSIFDEVSPEGVCHQAAQMSVSRSVREPAFDAEVNILGLLNVLDHAVRCGVGRVVFASSGGVLYGDVFEPAGEDYPSRPVSPYGISKWAGEQYLEFYAREHGINIVALRYANVYGPRQNPHGEAGVVAIFSQRMLAGEPTTINGDGRYIRDFVYVGDGRRANVLSFEVQLPQPFVALNIGTGVGIDINELAAAVRQQAERLRAAEIPPSVHGPARPGDLRSSLVSAHRARQLLGWEPQVPLTEGLRQTVDWFSQQVGVGP